MKNLVLGSVALIAIGVSVSAHAADMAVKAPPPAAAAAPYNWSGLYVGGNFGGAWAGWSEADRLGAASSWRMICAFVLNSPYPTAPFSTLYLYGRGQDIGFQKAIDNSPRKRHHIRFWALSLARAEATVGTATFWLNTDRPPHDAHVLWVGAGTKDTGLSLTRLTFQVTHATDSDTNAERDYITVELRNNRVIQDVNSYRSGQRLPLEPVNHYITDGDVTVATLTNVAGLPELLRK